MGRPGDYLQPVLNLVRKRPVLAIFEINLSCNSSCGYCDLPLNKGRYEMTREEISSVFADLYRQGIRYVFIQGGEPTLRKDLVDIIGDLHAMGFRLSLITNGTRLSRDFINSLAAFPVDISVSLDSLDREQYRLIRGADQLPLVMAGLERLRDYPHPRYITCIVSEQNRGNVLDVVRFARRLGFMPVVGAYHWNVERYGKADAQLQYEKTEAIKVFQQLVESRLVPGGYFRKYLEDNIRWLGGEGLERCDAGRYSIAIDPSGNVAACLAMQHVGNLRQARLEDILQKMNYADVDRCSAASSCNMMCSRVVGSNLRAPLSALRTPDRLSPC